MGWLGWSEDITLDTSMHGIRVAYEGRVEMVNAIFGGKPPQGPKTTKTAPPSAAQITSVLRALAGAPKGGKQNG